MGEDHMSAMTRPLPGKKWIFVTLCTTAGALAVPLHAIVSPVSAVVAGLLALLGLHAWRWSHLRSSTKGEPPHRVQRLLLDAVYFGLGLSVGMVILGVIRLVIEPAIPAVGARIAAAAALPVWRRILIIFVAAVGEELVFRLLLLSLLAGLMVRLYGPAGRPPTQRMVWVAIGLSAFAFALVHLPAWRAMGNLNLGLALIVLALNGLGGTVFGYLFANRGIVAAILAHAGADCVIQLIGPFTR